MSSECVADALDAERIARRLVSARYGRSLRVLSSTASTNDDAKQEAAAGAPDGHVVVADAQAQGRGSQGRQWSSPAGLDLYVSIVARPQLPLAELPPLTLAVGLGVAEAVELALGAAVPALVQVKWPNDVWLAGKKCAGILVEASSAGDQAGPVVIGIGLNVNRLEFPPELASIATSLRAARSDRAALDRAEVLALLLASVERRVDSHQTEGGGATAAALERRLALRGERVRCDGVVGTLHGVSATGALQIATAAGLRELIAGRLERE